MALPDRGVRAHADDRVDEVPAAGFAHPQADAIAALFVAVLVVAAAVRLMRQNVHVLMDRSPAWAEARARDAIASAEPTIALRRLRVREAGGRHFVDAVVGVRADAAIGQGHAVADSVEAAVR
ncbi:MAG TPA: cation transporter dimerization domain-containing protein, partial [Solirubrobacteraceae bacterium]|nr:cation transporter dimerization domain-containing protein [Solirubrobacteraceae bacterium]